MNNTPGITMARVTVTLTLAATSIITYPRSAHAVTVLRFTRVAPSVTSEIGAIAGMGALAARPSGRDEAGPGGVPIHDGRSRLVPKRDDQFQKKGHASRTWPSVSPAAAGTCRGDGRLQNRVSNRRGGGAPPRYRAEWPPSGAPADTRSESR